MNKKGFTLAEVLITLGIIGVVAALTLPTVISHHNKKVVETRLAKFYSVMNQAIQRSVVDNDEPEYWITDPEVLNGSNVDYNKLYEKYIIPYLDGVSITDVTQGRIYTLKDGSSFSPNYDSHCSLSDTGLGFAISKDVLENATWDLRSEKNLGKKIFCFDFPNISQKLYDSINSNVIGIFPTGYTSNNPICIHPDPNDYRELEYCAAIIMRNGWKIPDDYPIKF